MFTCVLHTCFGVCSYYLATYFHFFNLPFPGLISIGIPCGRNPSYSYPLIICKPYILVLHSQKICMYFLAILPSFFPTFFTFSTRLFELILSDVGSLWVRFDVQFYTKLFETFPGFFFIMMLCDSFGYIPHVNHFFYLAFSNFFFFFFFFFFFCFLSFFRPHCYQ